MKPLFAALFIFLSFTLFAQTATEPLIPVKIILKDSVACTAVKDQDQSPTCWAFGTNSLFESDLLKKYRLDMDLSEMFIARYAYIDKIKTCLATGGKTYAEGGGQFHDVIRVINEQGMMPESAYPGKPDGKNYHHHAKLDTAIKKMTASFLRQGKKGLDTKDLKQLNDTLDYYLGKVPRTFWYNGKQYDPYSFARDVMRFGDDYIELISFMDLPLYKRSILADKYNWANDSFYNITTEDMVMIIDTALARGWSVGWEGDVTETGFNYFRGFATLPGNPHDYDSERISEFKDASTGRDHMLHIVGAGRDEMNGKWYYMKNSWGTFSRFRGFLYMQEEYLKLKTVILMVNKEGLPRQLRHKLGLDAPPNE